MMTVNFSLIAKLHMKLCLIKVAKLEACIRPLFANPVTYVNASCMPTEPLDDYCHACGMTEACRDSDDDRVRNNYSYT